MELESTMKEALASRADALGVACMDTRSGLVLGVTVRGDVARDDVELAACSAAQLCSVPCEDEASDDAEEACDEAFISSSRWVHVYARVPAQRDLVIVGLAPGNTNVALLRAWIREVAERVGPSA